MKLRILIADDHEVVRRGLSTLLQTHEGWDICGEAKDGREAVEMAKRRWLLRIDFGFMRPTTFHRDSLHSARRRY